MEFFYIYLWIHDLYVKMRDIIKEGEERERERKKFIVREFKMMRTDRVKIWDGEQRRNEEEKGQKRSKN